MSINHPEFQESCRKCAAQVIISESSGLNWYACGSAGTFQSATCAAREPLANELKEARTRIKELADIGGALAAQIEVEAIGAPGSVRRVREWQETVKRCLEGVE